MQRTNPGERAGYVRRKLATRDRNVAGPRMCRPPLVPLDLPYRLRMRNIPAPDRSAWATLVKQLRAAAKMTGAELARRLDVDRATIWRWETGKQKPDSIDVIEAFASLFAIDVEEALTAAGLRSAREEVTPSPELRFDPGVLELQRMLDDPETPDATKVQIRTMVEALRNLASSRPRTPPAAPRRRRAG